MDFEEIYTAVKDQGGFDSGSTGSTLTQIKAWVNERYDELVVKSKWRKAQVELAVTVADQAEYAVPATVHDIVEGLLVGDVGYDSVGQETLWRLKAGRASVDGPVWAGDYTAAGAEQVELYPAPETAGESIQALAIVSPTPLAADGDVPIVPSDFHGALIDGAIALGYKRLEVRPDLAAPLEKEFRDKIEELRRRRNAKLSSGPVVMQVAGYQF